MTQPHWATRWSAARVVRRLPYLALLFGVAWPAFPLSAQSRVYVANLGSDDVSVIAVGTNTVVATIPVGSDPDGITAAPDGQRVYATNFFSDAVSVIDTTSNTVTSTMTTGSGPVGLAITTDGMHAYVTNRGSDTVSLIDTATGTAVATVEVGNGPDAIAITPNGARAYVTNSFTRNPGLVSVIDTALGAVAATVPVHRNPNRIAVTPDGQTAYVTNFRSWNVTVVDTATSTVRTAVRVRGRPSGVTVNPNGAFAYVTSLEGVVNVIDIPANRVGAIFEVGEQPYGLAALGSGGTAYVANSASNSVSGADLVLERTIAEIPVGAQPFAVAVTCTGNECGGPPYTPWPRPTPKATSTLTPTGTAGIEVPTRTLAPTRTPGVGTTPTRPVNPEVEIEIGSAAGRPGEAVNVEVSLLSKGASTAGIQNDILFDHAGLAPTESPRCRINPDIGHGSDSCVEEPPRGACKTLLTNLDDCPQAAGCPRNSEGLQRLRGLVLSTQNVNPVPDGVLYFCTFTIAADTPPDTRLALDCWNPATSDPDGNALVTACAGGEIRVLPPAAAIAPAGSGSAAPEAFNPSLRCSAGERDGTPCDRPGDCPGGACAVLESVCNGGEDDGLLCECPGGRCSASLACSADPSHGVCRGGENDGGCCSPTASCAEGKPCVATQKLCVGGVAKGLPCLGDAHCFDAACRATGRICQNGDFEGVGCVDDRDCPLGTCVAPEVAPTATRPQATPTMSASPLATDPVPTGPVPTDPPLTSPRPTSPPTSSPRTTPARETPTPSAQSKPTEPTMPEWTVTLPATRTAVPQQAARATPANTGSGCAIASVHRSGPSRCLCLLIPAVLCLWRRRWRNRSAQS